MSIIAPVSPTEACPRVVCAIHLQSSGNGCAGPFPGMRFRMVDPAAETSTPAPEAEVVIDLKNPSVAAILAWLIPGAGHFYQKRYAKGVLFMSCILGTFFFGLVLGEGKVVYADQAGPAVRWYTRWPYALQLGVGLPATPAILQSMRVSNGQEPILGGWMAPPVDDYELNQWTERLSLRFDVGRIYTMVAGLLNLLAIYDAFAGPVAGMAKTHPPEPAADPKRKRAPA
nr:DUF6677 family protein [Pirellula staleyi]